MGRIFFSKNSSFARTVGAMTNRIRRIGAATRIEESRTGRNCFYYAERREKRTAELGGPTWECGRLGRADIPAERFATFPNCTPQLTPRGRDGRTPREGHHTTLSGSASWVR